MGICFIGNKKFKNFIKNYIKNSPGKILDFEGNIIGYKVPYERSLDIDSESDRKMVKYLYKNLNKDLGKVCL